MKRDTANHFAQDKLQLRITSAYCIELTDPAIFRKMGEMGLIGVTIPERYDGLGFGTVVYGLVALEIERASKLEVAKQLIELIAERYTSSRPQTK